MNNLLAPTPTEAARLRRRYGTARGRRVRFALARLRSGISSKALGQAHGCSAQSINYMERQGDARLVTFWRKWGFEGV